MDVLKNILEMVTEEVVSGYYDVRCLGGYGDSWKEVKEKGMASTPQCAEPGPQELYLINRLQVRERFF